MDGLRVRDRLVAVVVHAGVSRHNQFNVTRVP